MKRVLLLVAGGRTDIQLLVDAPLGLRRTPVNVQGTSLREFHQFLLSESQQWALDVDAPPPPLESGSVWITRSGSGWQSSHTGVSPFHDESNKLNLCTPKLSSALDVFLLHSELQDWKAVGVLVLNTHRDANSGGRETEQEPVATGPILALAAAHVLGVELVESGAFQPTSETPQSACFNYLSGRDALFFNGRLNPVVLGRLDVFLKTLATSGQFDAVATAMDGGIHQLNDYIVALAQLHFAEVYEIRTPDPVSGTTVPATIVYSSMELPPATLLRLRKMVLGLVQRQDFYGASVMADSVADLPDESGWRHAVKAVNALLSGLPQDTSIIHQNPDFIHFWLDQHLPRCAIQALRVESALARHAIADAVLFTLSFIESAQRDLLELRLRQYFPDARVRINDLTRHIEIAEKNGGGCLRKPAAKRDPVSRNKIVENGYHSIQAEFSSLIQPLAPSQEPCLKKSENRKSIQLEIMTQTKHDARWRDEFIGNEHLSTYFSRLNPAYNDNNKRVTLGHRFVSPKDIRNMLAHSNLSPADLGQIHLEFIRLGIWPEATREAGSCFLAQPEVQAILARCGIESAVQHYQKLVNGLISIILA
ncbi:MAG: hypothetical protein HZB71_11290 [Betaproteobacteria bacterium]|nr:hypothetical protein [Betaproteobacteria bacterium]